MNAEGRKFGYVGMDWIELAYNRLNAGLL